MKVKRLSRKFFERKPEVVAVELLGKFLVRKEDGKIKVGKIVETEAYIGPGDMASHSARGKTKRNEVMFGPAGFSYVYFTYGMHWLLNIITEKVGQPSGVLIRAVEPIFDAEHGVDKSTSELKRFGSGPARLTKWLKIAKDQNNLDTTKSNELFIVTEMEVEGGGFNGQSISTENIVTTTRVGIDYAGEHKELPLRFYLRDSSYISKK